MIPPRLLSWLHHTLSASGCQGSRRSAKALICDRQSEWALVSLGADGASAGRVWCFTARNPLFLRRRAPRPPIKLSLQRAGRGASPPATLIPSSPGTTSPELNESSTAGAWCFTPRKPLFLRRRAPRRQARPPCHKKPPTPPHPRPSEIPSHPIFSASTYFSSTQWNCPHSHPRFDSHR